MIKQDAAGCIHFIGFAIILYHPETGGLRYGIGALWIDDIILVDRQLVHFSKHLAARSLVKFERCSRQANRFKQVKRRYRIVIDRGNWLSKRGRNGALGSKMIHF